MKTNPSSLDTSSTRHYLNKIESSTKSGGVSGYIASVKEAGMVPTAGLSDAVWHGWQAIKHSDRWHLVRSFTLLATSIASLPLIIVAPNLIVTTSDTLKVREQWDKPIKAIGFFHRIRTFAISPQLLVGVALGASAIALAHFKYDVTTEPNIPAAPIDSVSYPVLDVLKLCSILALVPFFRRHRVGTVVEKLELYNPAASEFNGREGILHFQGNVYELHNPQKTVKAEPRHDPEPIHPQAVVQKLVLVTPEDIVVAANSKCHVGNIKNNRAFIEGWHESWPVIDGIIQFEETELINHPAVDFSYLEEPVRIGGHTYQSTLTSENSKHELSFSFGKRALFRSKKLQSLDVTTLFEAKNRPVKLDNDHKSLTINGQTYDCELRRYKFKSDQREEISKETPANFVCIDVDGVFLEFPLDFQVELVTQQRELKLNLVDTKPFVTLAWRGEVKERPVCYDPDTDEQYVLIGGERHLLVEVDGRAAIVVDGNPFYLEYKFDSLLDPQL
ncbi:MAG: hypothetical protein Q8K75_08020 [Chlamydiales bacterium]|nr:hypothetical protein [Chlamydiales bacterium]